MLKWWCTMVILVYVNIGMCAMPEVSVYKGHYIGAILPTPQRCKLSNRSYVIVDANMRPNAAIVVPHGASKPVRIGAAELAERIAYLAGQVKRIPIYSELQLPRKQFGVLISLGKTRFSSGLNPPNHREGYVIEPRRLPHNTIAICAVGNTDTGTYFAAQTLIQLLFKRRKVVRLRSARIRDYPIFSIRSFKMGGQNWDMIREMCRWRVHFKWNVFNVCYTTVGRDQWKNPPAEYRQLLRELCEFSHARGLEVMAFINPYYLWREHIHISRDEDIDALVRTCSISLSAGSRKVMLCLDDFASPKLPYQLIHEDDRQRFGDLASANIYLINTLYKRLRARYPNVELFVVLPYYWLPRDYYREAGEKYLKRVGTALHPAITIVWTGPVVRSLVITEEDIHRYTQLIGRKPFLWDNTLYARHTPPSYLFDEFVTQYPRNMHELTAKGVHYNAGGSEIYKVGLITAADRLWNPEAYDPERSLRQALAIIGGPRCVDELLAFRNAYYELYDSWMHVFESLAQLKKHLPSIKTSPLDEQDINSLERLLDGLQRAFDAVQRRCDNAQLVEELRQRCKRFTSSRKVIAELRKRMSASQGQVQRIIIHATMEGNEQDVLRNIGCYRGAGGARIEISHDAYEGTQSAKLTATEWYPLHGRDWINVGLMIGNTDGYSGINALQVPAFTKCSFSLWIKGNVTKATISAVGWKGKCGRVDRHALPIRVRRPDGTWTQLNTKQEIQLTNKWHKVEGYFTTLLDTRRVALRIGIVGYRDRGAQLGTIWVDDVRIWYYQLDE